LVEQDYPLCVLGDQLQIVADHHYRRALLMAMPDDVHQLANSSSIQSNCRFIERQDGRFCG
jgi:hypothetical protein